MPVRTASREIHSARSEPINECDGAGRFQSILFDRDTDAASRMYEDPPETFHDLNLDQVIESVVAGRDEYNLRAFFHAPLDTIDTIRYRQAIFRDLETPEIFTQIQFFAETMRQMRACVAKAEKFYYKYQKDALFLNAAATYCSGVARLAGYLVSARLESDGFRQLRDYLACYVDSTDFRTLVAEATRLQMDLHSVRYSLHIDGKRVTVGQYSDKPDLSSEILRTFERFRQGAPKEYQFRISNWPEINHVEAAILDRVARFHPEVFSRLVDFPKQYSSFLNPVIAIFDREVQFYVACIEFKRRIGQAGFPFCYPAIVTSKDVHCANTFDLALADKLIETRRPVITNSFFLRGPERVLVVSGPNQGGKTTFARTFGQLHYLGCLGIPVPGTDAKLLLFDRLFTHFEKQEDLRNLSGRLEDELNRIHLILEQATDKSILIMNESFLSTTLDDALFLSKRIMERIHSLDMICVTVTFLDELASLNDSTVSMVSTVEQKDPTLRTFKIVRKPADGLAYAAAIAQKYRLTHDAVVERVAGHGKRVKQS